MPQSDFAKGAHTFVKRALANRAADLPGFPGLEIVSLGAAGMLTVAGAFGTAAMPPLPRAAFWLLLMGWNALKWQLWFLWRVKQPRDWWGAALLGTLVVNAPLPLEIAALLALVGFPEGLAPLGIWLDALVIALVILTGLFLWRATLVRDAAPVAASAAEARERLPVHPQTIHAVRAEDHYCRFHLSDGSERLILARFGDVLSALADVDGEQTHRGAWVASAAAALPIRKGRNWRLQLACGQELPVSVTYRSRLRARGWLQR